MQYLIKIFYYISLCCFYFYFLTPNFTYGKKSITSSKKATKTSDSATASNNIKKFTADKLEYNNILNLIIATGNVTINNNNNLIKADRAYVKQNTKTILIIGNIYYKQAIGNVVYSDRITIENNFDNMAFQNISFIKPGQNLFKAQHGKKQKNITTAYNTFYTTCNCEKSSKPFWSIASKKVVYNSKSDNLSFYGSWLQIKNTPIIYIPYLTFKSISKSRTWGILVPSYGNSSYFGNFFRLPVFIPTSKYSNLYFWVNTSAKKPLMVETSYSGYLKKGEYYFNTSLTSNNDFQESIPWTIFSSFKYQINDILKISSSYNKVSSRSYYSTYPFHTQSTADKNLLLFLSQYTQIEAFVNNHNYLSLRLDLSPSLNNEINSYQNPYSLPQVNYFFIPKPTKYGSFNLNINYTNLVSNKKTHTEIQKGQHTLKLEEPAFSFNKLSSVINHEFNLNTNFGIISLNSFLQDVIYYKQSLNKIKNKQQIFDRYIGGSSAIKFTYPLVSYIYKYNIIVTPVIQLVGTSYILPKTHNTSYLDPDSISISYISLFENNKYTGFDYLETHPRLNYGMIFNLVNKGGFSGKMLLGQSLNIDSNNRSNYLLYIDAKPSDYINISYEGVYDTNHKTMLNSNLSFFLGNNLFGMSFSYNFLKESDLQEFSNHYRDVSTGFYAEITKNIKISTSLNFDLNNNYISDFKNLHNLKTFSSNINWHNDCWVIKLGANRSYSVSRFNKPETSFELSFIFKGLGELNVNNDIINYFFK